MGAELPCGKSRYPEWRGQACRNHPRNPILMRDMPRARLTFPLRADQSAGTEGAAMLSLKTDSLYVNLFAALKIARADSHDGTTAARGSSRESCLKSQSR